MTSIKQDKQLATKQPRFGREIANRVGARCAARDRCACFLSKARHCALQSRRL